MRSHEQIKVHKAAQISCSHAVLQPHLQLILAWIAYKYFPIFIHYMIHLFHYQFQTSPLKTDENRRRSVNILTDRNNDITMSQLNLKSNSVVRHWRICTSELSSEDFLFRTYDFASLQMSKYNADFSKN